LSYLGAAIVAIAAVTLAGCADAGGTADAATGQLEQRTITVDSVPAAEEAGLYVAQAQIKSIAGGEAGIPDLSTGRAQLVAGKLRVIHPGADSRQVRRDTAGRQPGQYADHRCRVRAPAGHRSADVMPSSKFRAVAELAKAHARIGLNTAHEIVASGPRSR
jgi:hypothetical protein